MTAENCLLLLQRRAIPAFDEIADQTDSHIIAVKSPFRLILAWLNPDDAVHQGFVSSIRIGRSIAEAEEIACAFLGFWRMRRLHWHRAFLLPADHQKIRHVLHDIAQRMDIRVCGVGAELDHQIAMAEIFLQCIIGKARHALQLLWLERLEPKTIIKKRATQPHGDRQVIRGNGRPKNAGIGWRKLRIKRRRLATLHKKGCAFCQKSEHAFETRAITRQNIKRGHETSCRTRCHNARLMHAIKWLALLQLVAFRCIGHAFR